MSHCKTVACVMLPSVQIITRLKTLIITDLYTVTCGNMRYSSSPMFQTYNMSIDYTFLERGVIICRLITCYQKHTFHFQGIWERQRANATTEKCFSSFRRIAQNFFVFLSLFGLILKQKARNVWLVLNSNIFFKKDIVMLRCPLLITSAKQCSRDALQLNCILHLYNHVRYLGRLSC